MRALMSLAIAVVATVCFSGCQSSMVSSTCTTGCSTEIAPAATGDCGCGSAACAGACAGQCGPGGCDVGGCADGSCGDPSVAQAGGLLGSLFGRASTAGYETAGCGVGGCGMSGHLCGRCRTLSALRLRNRAAANHPYGGMSPHTPPQAGPYGGAMAPHYGYPYYTTRGPRDFFEANPPSLGR